ncbi:sialidase family protein [Jiangella alba]|nr:sialidase family protein [Jiangella alba]
MIEMTWNPRISRRHLVGGAAGLTGAALLGSGPIRGAAAIPAAADVAGSSSGAASLEFDQRAYVELDAALLHTQKATYPRIKKLPDGRYLLLYQDAQIGWNIFWSLSDDLRSWSDPQKLFAAHKVMDGQDDQAYSTADAVILANGDILAVCSYRASKNFYKIWDVSGLALRRSTDNGATWDDERVIYVGPNWEPYLCQLASGEVQVYFSHIAPKMAVENTPHSSGVAIIRSFDDGATWVPDVVAYPYAADRVAQQYRTTSENGVKMFTDQMPSAIETGPPGRIALAVESAQPDGGPMRISLIHTDRNWPDTLDMDETGPADRVNSIFPGAAPYLAQFPTGETVLAYNTSSRQYLRLGDSEARTFGEPHDYLPGTGYWGSIELTGDQTLVSSMAYVKSTGNALMIGTLHLNRALTVHQFPRRATADLRVWPESSSRLFLGGDSQAQVTIRAGRHGSTLLLRLERRDDHLVDGDAVTIYLASRRTPGRRLRLTVDGQGAVGVAAFAGGVYADDGATVVTSRTVAPAHDDAAAWELAVPLVPMRPHGAELGLTATLTNVDEPGGAAVTTSLVGVDLDDPRTWFDLRLGG